MRQRYISCIISAIYLKKKIIHFTFTCFLLSFTESIEHRARTKDKRQRTKDKRQKNREPRAKTKDKRILNNDKKAKCCRTLQTTNFSTFQTLQTSNLKPQTTNHKPFKRQTSNLSTLLAL
jgi:hypothetical protein